EEERRRQQSPTYALAGSPGEMRDLGRIARQFRNSGLSRIPLAVAREIKVRAVAHAGTSRVSALRRLPSRSRALALIIRPRAVLTFMDSAPGMMLRIKETSKAHPPTSTRSPTKPAARARMREAERRRTHRRASREAIGELRGGLNCRLLPPRCMTKG